MDFTQAALLYYALVFAYAPATFNERFGQWQSVGQRPSVVAVRQTQHGVGTRSRAKASKPLNILRYGKGYQNAGSQKLGGEYKSVSCQCQANDR